MPADQLGHLEHVHLLLSTEHGLECGVGIDHAALDPVLKFVALDVFPQLLRHLRTRQRLRANDRSKQGGRLERLHECRAGATTALAASLLPAALGPTLHLASFLLPAALGPTLRLASFLLPAALGPTLRLAVLLGSSFFQSHRV